MLKIFKEFEDRFQIFLGLALSFLMIEFFVSNRRNRRLKDLNLFDVKKG